MNTKPIKIEFEVYVGHGKHRAKTAYLRRLIAFTAEQVVDLPVMKVGRPIRWQESSNSENAALVICPAPGRYWAATPVGTYSANGWSGYIICWPQLIRVPMERTR